MHKLAHVITLQLVQCHDCVHVRNVMYIYSYCTWHIQSCFFYNTHTFTLSDLAKVPVLDLKKSKPSPWAFLAHKTHFHLNVHVNHTQMQCILYMLAVLHMCIILCLLALVLCQRLSYSTMWQDHSIDSECQGLVKSNYGLFEGVRV